MFAYPRLIRALLALFLFTSAGWSQVVSGSIYGTVRDTTGAAVSGATITVRNVETGTTRASASDTGGHYAAPSLPVGVYSVTASREGFAAQTRTGVRLVIGQSAAVDFSLAIGQVKQQVTVVSAPAAVELSTRQTSGLVDERQVKNLPLNGRSFDELITLNPAVVNYTSQRSGGIGTSNSAAGNMFAVAGHRPQDNLFLLNGIEYTGASEINVTPGGVSGQLLGVDAVREFNVVTDAYGAEYGKRAGAQISIVTASGTNSLHGSVFEFLRNSAFDARNYFDQGRIPEFQRNQFGGALGGPLRRNKAFLFGNYEGFRQNLRVSDVTLVPDEQARRGYLPGPDGQLTYVGVDPAVQPLLALWPMQNGPELGGGIAEAFSNPLQHIREDFGTARADYNISDRDLLFGVYTVDDSAATTPSANPLSYVSEALREQVASVQEQHAFSGSLLNTARIGYSRASFFFTGTTPVDLPGWIAGRPIGAIVIGGGTALNGASQISGAGTNAGSNLSTARNLYTYDDHVYWSRGIHQIEFGGWLQQIQSNDNMAQNQNGQASFGSLAAFLQGTVSTFTFVPSPTELGWRSIEGAGFVQDTIQVRPNLELRAGFRFESTNGWNESQNRASNYLFDTNGVIETNPRIGHSALTVNRAKFLAEPRVGLAWDPAGQGKTVVHAGFGVYRALLDNLDYRLDQTAPYNTTNTLKNVPVSSLHIVSGEAPPSGSRVSPSGVQPDAYTPTVLTWSLSVQRQIARGTSLTVGYVGSHGYHQILSEDVNEPVPVVCPAPSCPSTLPAGTVYYPKGAPYANPALANTTTWVSEGVSSYNGLEIDANHRFSRGLQLRGVYTWSKNLDDGTAWNTSVGANSPAFVEFPARPKLDWGPASTDVRNLAVISGTYDLPFGERSTGRFHRRLVRGWSVSEIATLQSGFPLTPQLGFNPTNNGDGRNPIRPSLNPDFHGRVIEGRPKQYFNPAAYTVPPDGTYGNAGRNSLIGPGLAELDASVKKLTQLTERTTLQFRAEFFNVLNHTNFGTPNEVVYSAAGSTPSPTAGVVTSTSSTSRQIQFGVKLLF
ncbi:MAG TPA: carboxypeptidase-like regulatory domain-containing protein [Acidobacteriaceae bacterium]|nr:carboxypeptidase-like regulatory domain-containing protein [Acidobacteriaceae bacterium]